MIKVHSVEMLVILRAIMIFSPWKAAMFMMTSDLNHTYINYCINPIPHPDRKWICAQCWPMGFKACCY